MSALRGGLWMWAAVAALAACGEAERPAEVPEADGPAVVGDAPVPEWVGRVAGIAAAIEAQPAAADSILAANDMALAEFEQRLFDIAASPTFTAAFESARRP